LKVFQVFNIKKFATGGDIFESLLTPMRKDLQYNSVLHKSELDFQLVGDFLIIKPHLKIYALQKEKTHLIIRDSEFYNSLHIAELIDCEFSFTI
jgi:hypothetical protein